jgi:hypothetical protein
MEEWSYFPTIDTLSLDTSESSASLRAALPRRNNPPLPIGGCVYSRSDLTEVSRLRNYIHASSQCRLLLFRKKWLTRPFSNSVYAISINNWTSESWIDIANGILIARLVNQGSLSVRSNMFYSSPRGPFSEISSGARNNFPGQNDREWSWQLSHLVLRFRRTPIIHVSLFNDAQGQLQFSL